ncbi:hypothetical protein [Deinococcus sp. QL22]|uniref:hypothetical protein n=1 Tax=Deinococcus sp. QL22 TaxID=2939437 RepID=UPI002017B1E5|nr:hypothetical protein [Deinococcus sp. QL22]UQN08043.1 hypothetical protein M1R55_18295 [Deinococcus sp. QL22]
MDGQFVMEKAVAILVLKMGKSGELLADVPLQCKKLCIGRAILNEQLSMQLLLAQNLSRAQLR